MDGQTRASAGILILLAAVAYPAAAQDSRPPVEIGANLNSIGSFVKSPIQGFGVRVGMPVNHRVSIEAGLAFGRSGPDIVDGYGVQVKHRIGMPESSPLQTFLTYGLAGVYMEYTESAHRVIAGESIKVVPAHQEKELLPPFLTLVGAGVERRLGRHLIVRAEMQVVAAFVVPVAVRATGGFSIPVGRSRSPSLGQPATGHDSDRAGP